MDVAETKISTEYDGKRRTLFKTVCQRCGTPFWHPKSRDRKFCSMECASRRIQRISVECANCGCTILRKPSALKNARHGLFFCGRECKNAGQRWDGSTPRIRPRHYGPGSYRQKALRKSQECADCSEKRLYLLLAHHKDGDHSNDADENLELVCGLCHMRRHLKYYGGRWRFSPTYLTPREMLSSV